MTGSSQGSGASNKGATGNYAAVNGLEMYYELLNERGAGTPLVLLHGGFGMVSMFARLLPGLSEGRQVIGVELQGHGHTADINRPFSFEQMADDVAALVEQLGLERVDMLGYSLGGGVALQTAIRHPEVVRKLVLVSAPFKRQGWYAKDLAGMEMVNGEMALTWVESPMYQAYASAAPKPEGWPALADKTSQLLRQDYDWSKDVAAVKAPVLIVVGDADGVRLEHAVEMYRLVGGDKADGGMGPFPDSQLAVLPGTTHLSMIDRADLLLPIIPPFLDTPMREGK